MFGTTTPTDAPPSDGAEGPPPSAAERRRARTRAEIVEAAWALCREQGLAALSLRELAGRVGLRAPSLYSYVSSKDEIYDLMFAEGQRQLLALLPDPPDGEPLTRAELRDATRAWFGFCTSDPVRYQLLFQRTIPGFEPSPESYGLAVEVLTRLGRALAAVGVTDPRHLDLWTALMTGLTDQQISNDPGGDRWARLLDEAIDLLLDHAGVPADRPTGRKR